MGVKSYYWDEETIKRRIKKYRDFYRWCKDENEKKKIIEIVYDLEKILGEFKDDKEVSLTPEEIIEENALIIDNNSEVGDIIKTFCDFYDGLNFNELQGIPFNQSIDNLFDFAYTLYEKFGDEIFNAFRMVYDKRKSNHRFYSNGEFAGVGVMYPIRHLNESYTASYREGVAQDYLTLIHEFGHGVNFILSGEKFVFSRNKLFSEVLPLFVELIGCDELGWIMQSEEAKKILHKDQVASYEGDFILSRLEWEATSLARKHIGKSQKKICELVGRQMKIGYGKAGKLISEEGFNTHLKYSISFALAIELYMIYKQDRNEAIRIIKELVKLNDKDTEIILKFTEEAGCYPGTRADKYFLKLKK